jgi:aquaporin Z
MLDTMSLIKAVVEFVGVFIFFFVIRSASSFGNLAPLAIGLTLSAVIFFGGAISGGHFNPGVTLMQYVSGDDKSMDGEHSILYVVAQLLGAVAAVALQREWSKVSTKSTASF